MRSDGACSVEGRVKIWAAPNSLGREVRAVRLHCRECRVQAVTVNGSAASFEHLDSHASIGGPASTVGEEEGKEREGDGEALDVHMCAALMAAADGELCVTVAGLAGSGVLSAGSGTASADVPEPAPGEPPVGWVRNQSLEAFRGKSDGAGSNLLVIEVHYRLDRPQGGFTLVTNKNSGPVLVSTGGVGLCWGGPDLDGARCRWPCLDGPAHMAPVDLRVNNPQGLGVVASGAALCNPMDGGHRFFVGPHVPMRAVGLAVGHLTRLDDTADGDAGDELGLEQWSHDEGLRSKVRVAATGLDAAALFFQDVLGLPGQLPGPAKHACLWVGGVGGEDALVFANMCVLNPSRAAHRVNEAELQLPSHLLQVRCLVLAWLAPLLRLENSHADGWILPGLTGWCVLRWLERCLGIDAHKLATHRLMEMVSARELVSPDAQPVSRGGSLFKGVAGDGMLGPSATEDPLLFGHQPLLSKSDLVFGCAKAALLVHMLEARANDGTGRDRLLHALATLVTPNLAPALVACDPSGPLGDERALDELMAGEGEDAMEQLDSRGLFGLVHGESGEGLQLGGGSGQGSARAWMEQWVFSSGVALIKCGWEYVRSRHEIELTLEQVVPPYRSDDSTAHSGAFTGSLLIRVVEVDDLVVDHVRNMGDELKYVFTFKCQTNKSRIKAKPGMGGQSGGCGDAAMECPVLWVKVDPETAWAREVNMRQPLDCWLEQLGRDGDADAQVVALGAVAERSTGQSGDLKAAAILADVCRGVNLPLPSAALNLHAGGGPGESEHAWPVRCEAAAALAKWQALHAPRSGVATLEGAWKGLDLLEKCLKDLFYDAASGTPLPLGAKVVRGTASPLPPANLNAPGNSSGAAEQVVSSEELAEEAGSERAYLGAFASLQLHVALVEAVASVKALNGATPLKAAALVLEALEFADLDPMDAQASLDGPHASRPPRQPRRPKRLHSTGLSNPVEEQSLDDTPGCLRIHPGVGVARLLAAACDVSLRSDEVGVHGEAWRRQVRAQARRLLEQDAVHPSPSHVVTAAALQLIGTLAVMPGSTAATEAQTEEAFGAHGEWHLARWVGATHDELLGPGGRRSDLVRLAALVGTCVQHSASGSAPQVLSAARLVLDTLFPDQGHAGSEAGSEAASEWLQRKVLEALKAWLSDSMGPGGALGHLGLLWADQRGVAEGLAGSSCASPSVDAKGRLGVPSARMGQLAKAFRDLVRGAVGYPLANELLVEVNALNDRGALRSQALAFVRRLWALVQGPELRFKQGLRYELKELWQTLLGHEVPPILSAHLGQAGQVDARSLIAYPTAEGAGAGSAPWQAVRVLSTPAWASGELEGILAHFRKARTRRAVAIQAGHWRGQDANQTNKRARGAEQEGRRLIRIRNTAAAPDPVEPNGA